MTLKESIDKIGSDAGQINQNKNRAANVGGQRSETGLHGSTLSLHPSFIDDDLDRPVGTIVYTQLCNERGGIEADVTITRLADDRFYFVTGSALGVRDRSTIERHIPAGGGVTTTSSTLSTNVTNSMSTRRFFGRSAFVLG